MSASPLTLTADVLLKAESRIRLLDRAVPLNLEAERERLRAAVLRGAAAVPELRYGALPEAPELRRMLLDLAGKLKREGPLGALLAGRAEELALEAALVEALGTPAVVHLARERFPSPPAADQPALDVLLERFSRAMPEPSTEERIESDSSDPRSLVRVLERLVAPFSGRVRVELRRELGSAAAAGDGVVFVRPGELLSVAEAERIAAHELEAHVLPRLAARAEPCPVYRAGARGAGEDEEGRALWLEERTGRLRGERRVQLALRHRFAELVRAGASFAESCEASRELGLEAARALPLLLRAHRGGGLCREIVYLPAYLRVSAAFAREPGLEAHFARGRVSLDAARVLEAEARPALQAQLASSIRTGA